MGLAVSTDEDRERRRRAYQPLVKRPQSTRHKRFTRAELDEKLELGQWLIESGRYWWREGRYGARVGFGHKTPRSSDVLTGPHVKKAARKK